MYIKVLIVGCICRPLHKSIITCLDLHHLALQLHEIRECKGQENYYQC